ncbi:MAG: endonuclease III domain-containing protein [Candidatus Eisenbacteria bacterium]|uniref:Endonuclease III domain-containing protein n=1 Tax=Eiseniibacteriota bacterium TaxID=2212470 RepID=A0A937X7Z8_UNCEI|nr:endonuclease III domain-containing protein [Candidatus Eisenbacteria bacterium]
MQPTQGQGKDGPVRTAYRLLHARHGRLGWWPGRTRLEIVAGAILTQNTAWANAAKAVGNLRSAGWLRLPGLRAAGEDRIAAAVRPSGYYRQKARKLKAFVALLDRDFGGSLRRMALTPTGELRQALLATWGIGPETADSILLYAFGRPVFVVDAYTLRVASRHGWVPEGTGYDALQAYFAARLPADAALLNDYHAQMVWVGKHHCRPRPRCAGCPLAPLLPAGGIRRRSGEGEGEGKSVAPPDAPRRRAARPCARRRPQRT